MQSRISIYATTNEKLIYIEQSPREGDFALVSAVSALQCVKMLNFLRDHLWSGFGGVINPYVQMLRWAVIVCTPN